MEEQGVVVSVPSPGRAVIRLVRTAACAGCHASSVCHPEGGPEAMVVEASDPLGVREGQRVALNVPPGAVLKASMAVYLLPVGVFVVLGGLAQWLLGRFLPGPHVEPTALVLGLAGLGFCFWWLQRSFSEKSRESMRPTIMSAE